MSSASKAHASEFVASMGPTLGPLYYTLENQTASVHVKWQEYKALFGTDKERVDFVFSIAPSFFGVVAHGLWEAILLHIARLTGPGSTGRGKLAQENVTLRLLPGYINDPKARIDLQRLVKAVTDDAGFIERPRNKWIAHLDYKLMLDPNEAALTLGSRKEVAAVLASISAVLDAVAEHFGVNKTTFDFLALDADAEYLLRVMRAGAKAVEAEHAARFALK